jgi:hypothetical protein
MPRTGPPVMNMSSVPGIAGCASNQGAPGRFNPPFPVSPIGWVCNCPCATAGGASDMAVPPGSEGMSRCSPEYGKGQ